MDKEIYVFIDNSFLFIQGYKHVCAVAKNMGNKKPQVNYKRLREYIAIQGEVKHIVLVGSSLSGRLIETCQLSGFEVFTLPKYPDFKNEGKKKEKGVDMKIGWEIAKTIFQNRDSNRNKKIILCTGDKDFASILYDIRTAGWEFELWLWKNSFSTSYANQVEINGTVKILDEEWKKFIDLV